MTDGIGGLSYVKGLLRASDKVSRARPSKSVIKTINQSVVLFL